MGSWRGEDTATSRMCGLVTMEMKWEALAAKLNVADALEKRGFDVHILGTNPGEPSIIFFFDAGSESLSKLEQDIRSMRYVHAVITVSDEH